MERTPTITRKKSDRANPDLSPPSNQPPRTSILKKFAQDQTYLKKPTKTSFSIAKAVDPFLPLSPSQAPRSQNRIYHQKTTKFQTQATYRRSTVQDPLKSKETQISEGDIFYNKTLDSNIIATQNSSALNFKFLEKICGENGLGTEALIKHCGEIFRLASVKNGMFNLEADLGIPSNLFTVSADNNKITIADKNFLNYEFIRKALV